MQHNNLKVELFNTDHRLSPKQAPKIEIYISYCCMFITPEAHFISPSRVKFFRESIKIYLHIVSYLHIDTTQVVEILPQIRQEPTYST